MQRRPVNGDGKHIAHFQDHYRELGFNLLKNNHL